jgi:hypothetical protein
MPIRTSRAFRRKIASIIPARTLLRLLYACRRLLGAKLETAILDLANPNRSRFVPSDISIEDFFKRLDERKVEYVVLRWFEGLPELDRKHDLDLLVVDLSVEALESELTHWPVGHPVDLFAASGERDRQAEGPAPLFPEHIAHRILGQRLKFRNVCYVPSPEDHFCALAYHATYIKGPASGIGARGAEDKDAPPPSHDYAATLRSLGARVGIKVPPGVTRDWLDGLLTDLGWRPDPMELERITGRKSGPRQAAQG